MIKNLRICVVPGPFISVTGWFTVPYSSVTSVENTVLAKWFNLTIKTNLILMMGFF